MEEMKEINAILQKYELHSGQAIHFQISGIYFSSNVRVDKQLEIKNILEVHDDLSKRRYLGLPSLVGKSKKQVFEFLKGKLWSKFKDGMLSVFLKQGRPYCYEILPKQYRLM